MRNINNMNVIQIDVTNICNLTCSNCTRFCGHYTKNKLYFMDLEYYEKALISVKNFPSIVGMIGGEPTLHPDFLQMCELVKKYIPEKHRRGLWTNTKTKVYKDNEQYIKETFGCININTHDDVIKHTPILVASEDLNISDNDKKIYIDNCWVQMTWSATITPKGGYFCEVAGMMSMLFENAPLGRDITLFPNWWHEDINTFQDQIDYACNKCGCAIPLLPRNDKDVIDDVSISNLKRLKQINSPKIKKELYIISDQTIKENQNRACDWYRTETKK